MPALRNNSSLAGFRPQRQSAEIPKNEKRSPRRLLSRFLSWVLLITFIVLFVYNLILKPNAQVSTSTTYRPISDYQKAANIELGKPINRNKLTIDDRSIVANLQHQFPEISGAVVNVPAIGHQVSIRLNIPTP